MSDADAFPRLARDAASRYARGDRFGRHFAEGKLRFDPVFRHIVSKGLLARHGSIVDVGCGQGVLAALIEASLEWQARGAWPAGWPRPARPRAYLGIDIAARDLERARASLAPPATFLQADMREAPFGEAEAFVILDVLHYVEFAAQEAVLERVRRALPAGGRLLLRVGARSGGLRFRYTEAVDRVVMRLRGHRLEGLYSRPVAEWERILRALGFAVDASAMSQGTGLANVLLVADLPRAGPPPG